MHATKGQGNNSFPRKYQSLKRLNHYIQDETLQSDKFSSKRKQDVDTLQRFPLQKDRKIVSFCENINCSKILPFIYRLKSFWRSVNPKSFLQWNKPVKMKTISHYIRKILSAERQEIDFFLWKYESLECFSLYTGRNPSVEVFLLKNI